jgi:flavorubredoxin
MLMKNKLRKNTPLLIIGFFLLCAIGIVLETQFKLVQRGYDNLILDNRNHYLSCEDLPARTDVEIVVEQHRDVIQQFREIAPGFVDVEIDSVTCEGKADLLIWYGTHQQRIAIEEIIGGDTFFGIPYRLQNR